MTLSDAQKARLNKISRENDGILPTDAVIDDARSPTSPLHELFPWDVETAAYRYWVSVANRIINAYTVPVRISEHVIRQAPVFIRSVGQVGMYVPSERMADEHELAIAALRREAERVLSAIRRMQAVGAILGLTTYIETLDATIHDILAAVAPEGAGTAGVET